jgi:NAD-dependent dihydropyrimidine dehydrogenase PreA subunit
MILQYLRNVSTLELDSRRCNGCGVCVEVCPHGVFQLKDRKARILDRDLCMECGACSRNCAATALSVRAGVGCAYAVLQGKLTGTAPECGCSQSACSGG